MRHLTLLLTFLLVFAFVCPAQEVGPQQWAGAGSTWNQYAAPQVNGILTYARRITSNAHPTYSFSAVNILSVEKSPFRVMTTTETGIAQHAGTFGPFALYGIGTIGLATAADTNGTATGATFSGGGLALAGIGRGWSIGPIVRIIKPTISDRQWAVGVIVGWGQ